MPENKHVQQQQQQQSPPQQKHQQQAQELQQQQAINANAESSRQPNRGGRPSTSRSSRQTYPNAWRMSVCCSSNSGSSIRGCNIQCSSNIQQLQQQHLAQLVTHKQLRPMLLHLPTKRDIIATYCLGRAAPPTLQPPPPREHQQHVVRSAAAATATAQLQQQQHEHL
ncbi:GM19915 [Drosophila sechellia]|uniref:GM19915 n=1 Tax=Drosophila sechellia TaxID=7238 RepID=B4HNK9_DROSE|nr:GM19915 [Drosophila sechellia]